MYQSMCSPQNYLHSLLNTTCKPGSKDLKKIWGVIRTLVLTWCMRHKGLMSNISISISRRAGSTSTTLPMSAPASTSPCIGTSLPADAILRLHWWPKKASSPPLTSFCTSDKHLANRSISWANRSVKYSFPFFYFLFDRIDIFLDNMNIKISGWPEWYFGWNGHSNICMLYTTTSTWTFTSPGDTWKLELPYTYPCV